MLINFEVPGEARGKGRPRFRRVGNYVQTYTPDETVSYENLVRLSYKEKYGDYIFPADVPLCMTLSIYLPIPKSVSNKKREQMINGELMPLKKPDSSNVLKAIEDGLNKVAYADDTQIILTTVQRMYGERPRVSVWLWEYEPHIYTKGEHDG